MSALAQQVVSQSHQEPQPHQELQPTSLSASLDISTQSISDPKTFQVKPEGTTITTLEFHQQEHAVVKNSDTSTKSQGLVKELDIPLSDNEQKLIEYCSTNNSEEVKRLIVAGVNVNIRDLKRDLYSALFIAAKKGNLECVDLLVGSGANINIENRENVTPLMTAAYRGHDKVVKCLLDHSADVDRAEKCMPTATMYAAMKGRVECLKLLLSKSPNLEHKNKVGQTALYLAAAHNQSTAVTLLLENTCNIDTFSNNGFTPLSAAATNSGGLDCVKILLDWGARIDVTNDDDYKKLPRESCDPRNGNALRRSKRAGRYQCTKAIEDHMKSSDYLYRQSQDVGRVFAKMTMSGRVSDSNKFRTLRESTPISVKGVNIRTRI